MLGVLQNVPKGSAFNLLHPLWLFKNTATDKYDDQFATGLTLSAGDIQVSKDGGAFANVTNLSTETPASSGVYLLALTAAEMAGDEITIRMHSAASAFEDACWTIFTKLDAQVIRRGTAQAGGVSTITLDAGASAIDLFYNDQMVVITAGTGAGQAQHITTYVGATKVATVGHAWITQPDNTSVFAILPADLKASFLDAATSGAAQTSDSRFANLDTTVSSRADGAQYTTARAGKLDNLDVAVSTRTSPSDVSALSNLDVAVSSRADGGSYTVGRAAALDNLDVAVSTRAAASAWTSTRAAKIDNLDVAVSTRAAIADWTSVRAAKIDNLDNTVSSRAAPGAAMTLQSNSIDAGQLTAGAGNKLADFTLRRALANARAANTGQDAVTFRSLLGAGSKLVNEIDVVGAQLIIKDETGSTFGTQNLTTSPGATPVTGMTTV